MRRSLALLAAVLAACGSRTPLPVDDAPLDPDGGGADARALDASGDARDAPDAPPPEPCARDADCADGVACTKDSCDTTARTCVHQPDDTQCPLSYGCDPSLGCQARALASTPDELYEVKLPSGATRLIGPTTPSLTDVALAQDRTVYGVSSLDLFRVDSSTAEMSLVGATGAALNALDVASDGTLFGAGDTRVFVVEPKTGATTFFASFPPGMQSSGDLAVYEGRILATAKIPAGTDRLIEVDRATRAARVVGDLGFACVYGLAAFGPTLYGLTCEGDVLTIDAATAHAERVAKTTLAFYGATAR